MINQNNNFNIVNHDKHFYILFIRINNLVTSVYTKWTSNTTYYTENNIQTP